MYGYSAEDGNMGIRTVLKLFPFFFLSCLLFSNAWRHSIFLELDPEECLFLCFK